MAREREIEEPFNQIAPHQAKFSDHLEITFENISTTFYRHCSCDMNTTDVKALVNQVLIIAH